MDAYHRMRHAIVICLSALVLAGCQQASGDAAALSEGDLPQMRWSAAPGQAEWNEAALEALDGHGAPLVQMVPEDIEKWCPAYPEADEAGREAFWIGFMSALAKHESTYKPTAVNPNGKWFGLLQISPATARGYDCRAGSGEALKDGGANLSCAIRIMAVTVPRDGVIEDYDGRWRGVAADWGPLRVPSKQRDIAGWLNDQPFCQVQ
ncbi:lytic transglycosylase [Roseobacter denitrificans]|nr:lytic transglycosylase [Roseobacter denitrificans]